MKMDWWYRISFIIIGVVSFFTGEVVAFLMLWFIFLILYNINSTLNKIYIQNNEKNKQD
ncbi:MULTISPECIES: hypothetical protein [unclassified Sutcliffiella]|uniref:hypothetical protein n=1 Tax=unclassified Sutcliffiella TaxID=2837532 RepID=UPI0030D3257C